MFYVDLKTLERVNLQPYWVTLILWNLSFKGKSGGGGASYGIFMHR
jgi:hypothetical protein